MDDSEAATLYKTARKHDPLPDIRQGLLNIDQIKKYVAAAGLICPFSTNEISCKPVSYGLSIRGRCVWWDDEGKKHQRYLSKNPQDPLAGDLEIASKMILKKNSIIFVTLGPVIRLPLYISARFNLRVKWIYAGLLIGTGPPLVDPGFENSLTCPIHNLTDQDHELTADGDPFAWIEFTKVAPWNYDSIPNSERRYANRALNQLLEEANQGNPIRNSIPAAIREILAASQRAETSSAASAASSLKAQQENKNVTIAAIVGIIALWGTFVIGMNNLSSQNQSLSVTGTKTYSEDKERLVKEINTVKSSINRDEAVVRGLQRTLLRLPTPKPTP